MSLCRRDVARELLSNFSNDNKFVDSVAKNLAQNKLKHKSAEKIIVMYYQSNDQLMRKLQNAVSEYV